MSNVLKSRPDDLTPQGSNPTTIIQKVIEICESGSRAARTGREFVRIKEHQNSVFTYKGEPAAYVKDNNGLFAFAVLDIEGPVLHTYAVDNMKNITQGADISFDSELPAVSSTDNGKVLKVVEGEWAKADESGGGGGIGYDLKFSGVSSNMISPSATSITVTDDAITAVADMDTLLSNIETYGSLLLAGGLSYTYEEMGLVFIYPVVLNRSYVIPNAMAAQMVSDIGNKDAVAVEVYTPQKYSLYYENFAIYETAGGVMKAIKIPS